MNYFGAVACWSCPIENPASSIDHFNTRDATIAIMATKSAAVGSKRKVAPSGKAKFDDKAKKPRIDGKKSRREPVEEPEDDSDDASDSEEGGASLEAAAAKKSFKEANGLTFERGEYHCRNGR